MKHLFGPVNSRRLGLSLGIDLLPRKICSFDCIYCELGRTTQLTCERSEYIPTKSICDEVDRFLADAGRASAVDVFTVTASGEPTLHSGLGEIIRHIKKQVNRPVAVLTNGSLLHRSDVRRELSKAEIIVPSLDAARPESFRKINRPDPGVRLDGIIEGLVALKQEVPGQVWLEILFAQGINDHDADIDALNQAIARIKPDRIQCNTVARPPAESHARPLSPAAMQEIISRLHGPADRIDAFAGQSSASAPKAPREEILRMLERRPCTATDICQALHLPPAPTEQLLKLLMEEHLVQRINHNNQHYYQVPNA